MVGQGQNFFAPWIYKYNAGALKELLKVLPKELSHGSLYCEIYSKFKFKFILDKLISRQYVMKPQNLSGVLSIKRIPAKIKCAIC